MIKILDIILLLFKGNPKACFVITLKVLFWDLKGIVPSSFKVTISSIYTLLESVDLKLLLQRSITADDLKLWVGS